MIQQKTSFQNPITNNSNYSPFGLCEGSETHSNSVSNGVWRMEVRPGDDSVPYGSYRAELTITTKNNANTYKANAYRLSSRIPSGTWSSRTQEEIFPFQFHPWASNNNGGSPSLAVEVQGDYFQAVVRYTSNGNEIKQVFKKGKVERDVWVDWIIYYQPHVSTGKIIIWRRVNGVDADYKIWFEYNGPCLHSWSEYPFLKTGIYWWNRPSTGTAEMSRVGQIKEIAFGQSNPESIVNEFRLGAAPVTNTPPVANAGPDQVLPEGATSTQLDGEATDPNNHSMTPKWSQVTGTTTTFTATDWNPVITGMLPGDYTYRLTVVDALGASHSDDVRIIVTAPKVPLLQYAFSDVKNSLTIECYDDNKWKIK